MTFDGFADPHLAAGDPVAFGRSIAAKARRDYEGILRSFFPEGRRPTAADFDDRSIPFAAASLEVSLAVGATAKAWLYAWHRAHGDLEGAPLGAGGKANPFEPAGGTAAPEAAKETGP
ncbi:MAG: hypothetical protein D6718_13955 [Acidobacteria bacterium]|nr:MAG: hypothetical protein D6718_13955 [Acidobacteriota bacterium]